MYAAQAGDEARDGYRAAGEKERSQLPLTLASLRPELLVRGPLYLHLSVPLKITVTISLEAKSTGTLHLKIKKNAALPNGSPAWRPKMKKGTTC